MSRPTPEQVERAFVRAAQILAQIEALGVNYPSVELFSDASGIIWFTGPVTTEQWQRLSDLIHSSRPYSSSPDPFGRMGIEFCEGLFMTGEGKES